ncbi:MAG TPA: S8/S53 family peptidase, partial [Actinomycetota bacterium]|nr:S8/S53 family peptidase [Actinomycetota bacterium]
SLPPPATGAVRDNIYFRSPLDATRAGVESGQTIVFSAGNGFANAFDVPMFTYWSSEKGPDWMITVGAVDPDAYQQYSGAGKPVDISSIGTQYPSSGGSTPTGYGEHSGTSNAAPVTAGTFAKLIQAGRSALGDLTETHANGVVASGTATGCSACPLNDGVLTRSEVQNVVFRNVVPSELGVAIDTVWPSTRFNYYYQGHGVIRGYADSDGFVAEQQRFIDGLLTGSTKARPAGETNWFVVDSKCRQKLWGSWNDGYYKGSEPSLSPVEDPIASAFNGWCSLARNEAFREIGRATGLGS